MALQDILKKIEKETEIKISEINQELLTKLKELETEYQKKEDETEENINKSIEDKLSKIDEKASTLKEREIKNNILKAKRQIIEEIVEDAIKALSQDKNYSSFIQKLLEKIDIESGEIIPAQGKEDETLKAIKESKKDFKLKKDSDRKFIGGFILVSNKIEIDNSFETIVKKQLREELEINLNKLLFQ